MCLITFFLTYINHCFLFSFKNKWGPDQLMADEFSAELAEGVAYVAGHDEESRPVMVTNSLLILVFISNKKTLMKYLNTISFFFLADFSH